MLDRDCARVCKCAPLHFCCMGKNMVTKGEEEHDKQTLMTQPADAKGAGTNKETKETERRQRQIATAGNERVGLHTVAKGVGGWVGGWWGSERPTENNKRGREGGSRAARALESPPRLPHGAAVWWPWSVTKSGGEQTRSERVSKCVRVKGTRVKRREGEGRGGGSE